MHDEPDDTDLELRMLRDWLDCLREVIARRYGQEIPPDPGEPDHWRSLVPPTREEILVARP